MNYFSLHTASASRTILELVRKDAAEWGWGRRWGRGELKTQTDTGGGEWIAVPGDGQREIKDDQGMCVRS